METMVNNAAVTGEMFDAFKKGDIETLLSYTHPDVTWISTGSAPNPYAGVYRGHKETASFFYKLAAAITFQEFVVEKILNADEHTVVSIGHFKGTANTTGKELKSDWVMI